jgi:ligand-binding sensor domain-containing protein
MTAHPAGPFTILPCFASPAMRFRTTSIRLLQPCLRALLSALSVCMWAGWVLAQDPPYKAFTTDDGLPSNTVYDALQDRDAYMWFATDAGVCRFDGARCERFTTKEGLTDNEVLGLFEDSQGRIWFLTMNGRPCYFQGGRFHNGSDHPEFNERHLTSGGHSMAEDSSGAIWMSSIGSDLFCWRPGRMTNWTDTIAIKAPMPSPEMPFSTCRTAAPS